MSWIRSLWGYQLFTQAGIPVPQRPICEIPTGTFTDDAVGNRTIYTPPQATPYAPSGDIGGTSSAQIVEGIQQHAVSSIPPTDGQELVYTAALSEYVPTSRGPTRYGTIAASQTTLTTPVVLEYFDLDPSVIPSAGRTITLRCVLLCATSSDTCVLTLMDADTPVQIAQFSASNTAPTQVSATLSTGTPGTNTIANSSHKYYWTLARSGGSASDAVSVLGAFLEVKYS